MKIEDYPNLLIVKRLIEPIERSIKNITESKDHLQSGTEKILVHGVFVLSVASMEVMISDVLKYYLMHFPQKLSTDFKFDKEEFFENHFTLLERIIENHLNKIFHESFDGFFDKFLKYLSIEWSEFRDSFGKYLQEIKATRNILLHNNLVVNDQYLECAGSATRSSRKEEHLKVDYVYAVESLDRILAFERDLRNRVSEKYKEYTKINANKKLWQFMFQSPVMPYDDYWHYDENKDHIFALKRSKYENALASSETILLGLWRNHFTYGDGSRMKDFNMKYLDRGTQEKVMFFLSIAGEFSFE